MAKRKFYFRPLIFKKPRKVKELLEILGDRNLVVSLEPFGSNRFFLNIEQMRESYRHPITGKTITFRAPTTAESILAVSANYRGSFSNVVRKYSRMQLGYGVKSSEGIFVNPPLDEKGNPITSEEFLKANLRGLDKTNGYFLGENDFGFAPYDSFIMGDQSSERFLRGGLARVLEHKYYPSSQFTKLVNKNIFKRGVNVKIEGSINSNLFMIVFERPAPSTAYGELQISLLTHNTIVGGYSFGVLEEPK